MNKSNEVATYKTETTHRLREWTNICHWGKNGGKGIVIELGWTCTHCYI